MFQVREIRGGKNPVYGIALPKDLGILNKGVFFSIKQSGTSFILESGCRVVYTENEIENYKFEDSRL
jgi:hypothetical protein